MAWFEHIDLNRDHRCSPRMFGYGLPLPGEKKSPNEELLDGHTALRWSGRDPYQLKVLGRVLEKLTETQYLRGKIAAAIASAVGPVPRPAQGARSGALAQ